MSVVDSKLKETIKPVKVVFGKSGTARKVGVKVSKRKICKFRRNYRDFFNYPLYILGPSILFLPPSWSRCHYGG